MNTPPTPCPYCDGTGSIDARTDRAATNLADADTRANLAECEHCDGSGYEPSPILYWVADGPVRGECGHKHRHQDTAVRCAQRDMRDVKRGHGPTAYSDRRATAVR